MKHDQLVSHTDTESNVLKAENSFYPNVPPKIYVISYCIAAL